MSESVKEISVRGMRRTHDEIIDKEKGDERRTDAETA